MRFEVPQFIDVEDKLFGPLTFKQFIYVVGGAGLAYVSYKLVPFPVWPAVSLVFIALGLLLAFYKLNNQTFLTVAQSWISYTLKGKLYIWKRTPPKTTAPKPVAPAPVTKTIPEITDARITELAQNLDILDH
jgi:hypothetical protein